MRKRFGVGPEAVGGWLAVVGDDSGNEILPGVKGLGAKGATTLIEEHGSIGAAMAKLDTLEGRLGKALRAAKDDVPKELARAGRSIAISRCRFRSSRSRGRRRSRGR